MKIAVIGSGISGLASAYLATLNGHDAHLFESADYFGGHSNTIDVSDGIRTFPVDTGFLVCNPGTYPNLIQLFQHLDVQTHETEMTLSVQSLDDRIEWAGGNVNTLFGDRRNILRPKFYRMIFDILRLNSKASDYLEWAAVNKEKTLGEMLDKFGYSKEVRDWYVIPMAASIWSSPRSEILNFPAFTYLRFCLNHNLMQTVNRPTWRTVVGGSREYVKKITEQIVHRQLNVKIKSVSRSTTDVQLAYDEVTERFDRVIFATPPDITLRLLSDPTEKEKQILSAFKYQSNLAVVHSDISFLPNKKSLWSAWNAISSRKLNSASLSYSINLLQKLPTQREIIVTLNPHKEVASKHHIKTIDYRHPLFDVPTIQAQSQMHEIQGKEQTYFAGAWLGYGFHEDGLKSALRIARMLNWQIPWEAVFE